MHLSVHAAALSFKEGEGGGREVKRRGRDAQGSAKNNIPAARCSIDTDSYRDRLNVDIQRVLSMDAAAVVIHVGRRYI